MSEALTVVCKDIYDAKEAFCSIVTDKSINFEREAGFAIQVISASDYMLKTAIGNRQSVVDAVTNIAAIGISLNPAKKQAYLIPRKGKVCLDISYMGLMDLAIATGSIKWAQAAIVHEKDAFTLNGMDKLPTHSYNPFGNDRGGIVGVYCVVKTKDDEYLTHTMDIIQVHSIRDRSEAWKKDKSGPWKTDEVEMIKKTCVKQAYKYWPKSDRLDQAIHYLNTETEEKLEFTEKNLAPEKKPSKSVAKEMFESMTLEIQDWLRTIGMEVTTLFLHGDVSGAIDQIDIYNLDNDQILALWSLLDSKCRSAIKKEKEAQEKRLNPKAEDAEFTDVPHQS